MIVIDASVATKLINTQEDGSIEALLLLKNHLNGVDKIIIPQLLYIEVANALTTKTLVHEDQIREGINLLYKSNFIIFSVKEKNILEASLLARKHKTSIYDMLYAIIAKENNIKLITADERFVNKVDFSFIRFLNDN